MVRSLGNPRSVRTVTQERRIRAALGAARFLDCDLVVRMPPMHPTGHAALQLDLTVDGDLIIDCDPRVGLMHRSAEKLFEARDYRQVLMLASRHDWLGSFSGEHGAALVIEEALGIVPPERARWSRTLLAELSRASAALAFLSPVSQERSDESCSTLRLRESLVQHLERATGNRVHPMITRIGGIGAPLRDVWISETAAIVRGLRESLSRLADEFPHSTASLAGLGVLDGDLARELGASGPVGRASGVDLDARRIAAYDAYPECVDLLRPAPRLAGDAQARYAALADDALVALDIVDRCSAVLSELGDMPIDVPLPKVVRVPEGQTYRVVETPLGMTGFWLMSIGDRSPWRLKLRTPSFSHVQAMANALRGVPLSALPTVIASFFIVVGDIDR